MARLKLFKLTSGFHDSYVAAASRPAALKAWGARTDLFAMGAAEQVDDPAILAKAAKKPGVVLQKRRTKGGKLETHEPRKTARPDLAKAKRDCDVIARRLARAETARNSELKKLDMTIKRLAAKRQAAEAKHIQFIEGLKEDLQRAGAKLDF